MMLLTIVILLGGCDQKQPSQSPIVSSAPPVPRNGRYAIVFSPIARADMFLLDTQLGKVWTLTIYTDIAGEPSVWKDMTIVDDGPDDTKIPGSVTIRQLIEIYPQKQESKAKK